MSAFTATELDYIAHQKLGRLATLRPDGTLQASPVGFEYNSDLDTIDVNGYRMTKSQKFRNVADNGQVAFVIDDLASVEPWRPRCVEIRGRGEALPESPIGPIIRIHPARVISFGIEETDVEAHSVTVSARDID